MNASEQITMEAMKVFNEFAESTFDEVVDKRHVYTLQDGIRVLHFPELLHVSARSVIAGCVRFLEHDEFFIVIDDQFMDIPEDIQKWMIYHELGHIKYKHLDNMLKVRRKLVIRTLLNKIGLTTKEEIEADRYATKNTSVEASLKSLEYLQGISTFRVVYRELSTRKLCVRLFGLLRRN